MFLGTEWIPRPWQSTVFPRQLHRAGHASAHPPPPASSTTPAHSTILHSPGPGARPGATAAVPRPGPDPAPSPPLAAGILRHHTADTGRGMSDHNQQHLEEGEVEEQKPEEERVRRFQRRRERETSSQVNLTAPSNHLPFLFSFLLSFLLFFLFFFFFLFHSALCSLLPLSPSCRPVVVFITTSGGYVVYEEIPPAHRAAMTGSFNQALFRSDGKQIGHRQSPGCFLCASGLNDSFSDNLQQREGRDVDISGGGTPSFLGP
ncbi:unnamed protein product [Pleuronectes platessa]|uniref:Uncharacterized protein n=1 Tax=Pleuronectes platessa TaxID=8262 RepID=A0A9N7Y9D7_PLEPL|nr:unnamed protein product [Pleuronectes platessa]